MTAQAPVQIVRRPLACPPIGSVPGPRRHDSCQCLRNLTFLERRGTVVSKKSDITCREDIMSTSTETAGTRTRWTIAIAAGVLGACAVGGVAAAVRDDAPDTVTFAVFAAMTLPFVAALVAIALDRTEHPSRPRTPSSPSGRRGPAVARSTTRWSRWGWPRSPRRSSTRRPCRCGSSCCWAWPTWRPAWCCSSVGRADGQPAPGTARGRWALAGGLRARARGVTADGHLDREGPLRSEAVARVPDQSALRGAGRRGVRAGEE